MTFNEIMNSPLLYGLVGLGIAYIILFCLITLKKAYKHALELGITREKLKLVITSSAIYSVVPSFSAWRRSWAYPGPGSAFPWWALSHMS